MNNLYKIAVTQRTDNSKSFDYKSAPILLRKTLSPNLFENSNLAGFLDTIDQIVVNNIEAVKRVRIFNNFSVNKDEKGIG